MNLPDFFLPYISFSVKAVLSVGTPSPKRFWTSVCRLSHKLRKGLCLTPKRLFRLMKQGPFLLCLCQRGAFTGFWRFFFSLFPCAGSGKPCMTAWSMNVTSRHPQQANREEWFYLPAPTCPARQIKPYFLAGGLPGFTLPAIFFFVGRDFFFHGFLFWSFQSNLPLLPFTSIFASFSDAASGSHFRSGRKGNSGIGRESKVKPPVFWKNLQPCG